MRLIDTDALSNSILEWRGMRLIDAKELFDKVGKIKPRNKEHYKSIGEFMNLITNSPTIDAVAVEKLKMGCTGCVHYDQQQTALICRDCKRSYSDMYEDGE